MAFDDLSASNQCKSNRLNNETCLRLTVSDGSVDLCSYIGQMMVNVWIVKNVSAKREAIDNILS